MKEQIQKFHSLMYGRLILLTMILFISQGVVFSQGIKTVTTNANDGPGSLRQTIAEAVDGDIINFSGAVTEITVDSALTLGDKSITIDGGGDVILQRDLISIDSFRVVTINMDSGVVVTIKNLTIQNGLTLNEDGGGLLAQNNTYGKTVLEGVVFKNNVGSGKGGGLYIDGGTDSLLSSVIDCEIMENKVVGGDNGDGDGGGIWAEYTEIIGCTISDNACDDDGGAAWVTDGVIIENTVMSGNTCGDVGGAMRIQDRSVVVRNSTFESNSSEGNAGAVMLARGTMINCDFINNSSVDQGGAVLANQNECYFYDCYFEGNSSQGVAGAFWMDDGGFMKNCIVVNNTAAVNGGGVYLAGKRAPALLSGCVIAGNAADSIGGGVFVADGDVINSTIINNYAADNGGALAGDGAWLLANSIVFNNDATGDDKNIHVVSNSVVPAATNSAIDATGYNAAAWVASNITTLDASPFIGGSDADSLMLPSGSPLIDAGDTTGIAELVTETDLNGVKRVINGAIDLGVYERYISLVVTTDADEGAGSLRQAIADAVDGESLITFADGITTIPVDQPLELGGKSLIIDGEGDVVLDGAFNGDPALDTVRIMTITGDSGKMVTVKNLKIQNGFSRDDDGGGLYADHSAGGKTHLENVVFENNSANGAGGGAYVGGYSENYSTIMNCEFTGNTAVGDDGGAAFISYTKVSGSTFTNNEAGDDGGALWYRVAMVDNSVFTGNIAADAGGAIRIQDQEGSVSNSTFDSNTAGGNAGAVFMARGSIYDSEFTNNSSTGSGGAIFANQNECIIDNSMFHGNSSSADGGAVYVDDGGTLINCVVTDNSAVGMGGGIYLKGDRAPALAVGCLFANNTADANGGGLYLLSGDVINSIITDNYAGTNGGAFTGDTGPWFIANTVVWNNDAAGTDKNIEYVSNSAAQDAAYSAIDATAYNDSWTATNIATLDASPFVGGTGADSLNSISSKLIDAGTLEFGVIDVLPENDLAGNQRIQSTIDMGAFETEKISVLGVTLDRSSIEVSVGGTGTLVATIEPDFATDKSIIWTSSDEAVATVADGVVSGVSEGTATITATTVDGEYTASAEVTVNVAVTGVTLNEEAITIEEGQTFSLVATVIPENATNQTVGWVSGNEEVATVDNNGLVTAVSIGTASISVVTVEGSFLATCEVTVTEPSTAVTGVSLDQTTLALEPGGTGTLVATVAPEDATDKSVTWSSSDESVATVADGVVTAVANGTCTITVTTTDGDFTATCEVSVESVGIYNQKAGYRLYPNPVQNHLYIEGENIHSVALYSVTGTSVMIVEKEFSKGINLAAIESGMYFVKVTTDKGTAVTTIIKK